MSGRAAATLPVGASAAAFASSALAPTRSPSGARPRDATGAAAFGLVGALVGASRGLLLVVGPARRRSSPRSSRSGRSRSCPAALSTSTGSPTRPMPSWRPIRRGRARAEGPGDRARRRGRAHPRARHRGRGAREPRRRRPAAAAAAPACVRAAGRRRGALAGRRSRRCAGRAVGRAGSARWFAGAVGGLDARRAVVAGVAGWRSGRRCSPAASRRLAGLAVGAARRRRRRRSSSCVARAAGSTATASARPSSSVVAAVVACVVAPSAMAADVARPLILALGGTRSGKSRFGLAARARWPATARAWFLATAWPGDPELDDRIARHRRERPADWPTIEVGSRPRGGPRRDGARRAGPDRRPDALAQRAPGRRAGADSTRCSTGRSPPRSRRSRRGPGRSSS